MFFKMEFPSVTVWHELLTDGGIRVIDVIPREKLSPAYETDAERLEQERFDAAKKYKASEWFGYVYAPVPDMVGNPMMHYANASWYLGYYSAIALSSVKPPLWVWGSKLVPNPDRPGDYVREPDYSVAVLLHEEV